MRQIEEGECYEVMILREGGRDSRFQLVEEWLEVACYTHTWECRHHHTRWGPVLRCVARHVASMVEGSESEQVTSESPSAVS